MGSGGGQYLVDAATFLIEQKEMLFNMLVDDIIKLYYGAWITIE